MQWKNLFFQREKQRQILLISHTSWSWEGEGDSIKWQNKRRYCHLCWYTLQSIIYLIQIIYKTLTLSQQSSQLYQMFWESFLDANKGGNNIREREKLQDKIKKYKKLNTKHKNCQVFKERKIFRFSFSEHFIGYYQTKTARY